MTTEVSGNSKDRQNARPEESIKIRPIIENMERTFLPLGTTIGRYCVIEEIDRGGMAVVYKAVQTDLNRVVALKVLPANITINRKFVERFLSEAHSVARLSHPNIVTIHEVSMENNVYFLAMDYLPGANLYHFMNERKPKVVDILTLFVQLADALSYAHGRKILHRDLKLNNVIMRDNKTPVLIDFGLAKVIEGDDERLTRTGEILGSPAYMSPERMLGSGRDDARSDICSLGIMLYEMLTLKNPYLDQRSIQQTALNVIEASPVPPRKLVPWLPLEVEAITLKAMHREPSERYQSMAEFREDLLRYQKGETVLASPPSLKSRTVHAFRKYRLTFAVSILVLVFGGLLAAVMLSQSRREKSRWCSIYENQFDNSADSSAWVAVLAMPDSIEERGWKQKDGALRASSKGFSFMRLQRPFTRDGRFEFDINTGEGFFRDAGFFICGSTPDSGYAFHINGGASAKCGITRPGSSFLFSEYDPAVFPAARTYHVEIELFENTITFRIDGFTVCRMFDHFLPAGGDFRKAGFFVDRGTVVFDNLKIYRKAVPELASPTLIADRLREHGDYSGALAEYEEVLVDISRLDIVRAVKLGMAECLMRQGNYSAAVQMLEKEMQAAGRSESHMASVLYLRGMTAYLLGRLEEADRRFEELARHFPASTVNNSAAALLCTEAFKRLCADASGADSRFSTLARRYPGFCGHLGYAHLGVLTCYINNSMEERARMTAQDMDSLYNKWPDVIAGARVIMAGVHLGKRQIPEAVRLLNLATAAHPQSEYSWRAWMKLGEINEYEQNLGDAMVMYNLAASVCPSAVPVKWEAIVRKGELARRLSMQDSADVFLKNASGGKHPFALPRLAARYYLSEIGEDDFVRVYCECIGDSSDALYYLARKAIADSDIEKAVSLLDRRLDILSPGSWDYLSTYALKQRLAQ